MCNSFLYFDWEVNKITQLQFKKIYDSTVIYSAGENQFLRMQNPSWSFSQRCKNYNICGIDNFSK